MCSSVTTFPAIDARDMPGMFSGDVVAEPSEPAPKPHGGWNTPRGLRLVPWRTQQWRLATRRQPKQQPKIAERILKVSCEASEFGYTMGKASYDAARRSTIDDGSEKRRRKENYQRKVSSVSQHLLQVERNKRRVLDPRTSRFLTVWDIVAAAALIYTALVSPFETGFLTENDSATEPLFIINRLVDFVFTVDLVLQFFIMYPDHSSVDLGLGHAQLRTATRRRESERQLANKSLLIN